VIFEYIGRFESSFGWNKENRESQGIYSLPNSKEPVYKFFLNQIFFSMKFHYLLKIIVFGLGS